MLNNFKHLGVIILAAGRGKRLGCEDVPKVLCKIGGKPIISYILGTFEKNQVSKEQICIVVGFQKEKIINTCGGKYPYGVQEKLLGTAHAAKIGEKKLPKDIDNLLILNGDDSAFYTFNTLNKFIGKHLKNNNEISLLTCVESDVSGLGIIIRNKNGEPIEIREKENHQPGDKKINEASTGTFCFKRKWFKEVYPALKPIPNLGEVGLPAFILEAVARKAKFQALKLKNSEEWFGINTKEQLAQAEILEQKRQNS